MARFTHGRAAKTDRHVVFFVAFVRFVVNFREQRRGTRATYSLVILVSNPFGIPHGKRD
jgi:hypothetical protein